MVIQAVDLAKVSGKLFLMHEKIQQAKTEIISNGVHIWREFFSRKSPGERCSQGKSRRSQLPATSWPSPDLSSLPTPGCSQLNPSPTQLWVCKNPSLNRGRRFCNAISNPPSSLLLSQSKPVTLILSSKKNTSHSAHRPPGQSLKIAG